MLLNRLKSDLQIASNKDPEDQELIMRLSPLFDQQLEQAKQQGLQEGLQQGLQEGLQQGLQEGLQQGLQQGQRRVIESLLRSRFGELESQLAAIIDPILAISLEESIPLLVQLSREELLARFTPKNCVK